MMHGCSEEGDRGAIEIQGEPSIIHLAHTIEARTYVLFLIYSQ